MLGGADVLIPTLPLLKIRILSDCDAVLKIMASDVPAPLVDCNVSVDDTAVPPLTNGITALVVIVGVAMVGEVANTFAPVPVSSVNAAARFADEGVAKNVATLVPNPLTPVDIGRPVQFVRTPEEGVPISDVVRDALTKTGPVANTNAPVPVSPVTAAARLAELGVARNVATPVPRPFTPVETGKPVQLVRVPEVGVPNSGVAKVGLVANTKAPLPVSSVTADAKLALEGVARNVATPVPRPLTPVETGRPVQFVNVPEVGVPKRGVTRVGLVANTLDPVPVSSVKAEARLAEEGVARNVATPLPSPDTPVEIGRPVQLVSVPDVGVPIAGVTRVGDVASTTDPVPVTALT